MNILIVGIIFLCLLQAISVAQKIDISNKLDIITAKLDAQTQLKIDPPIEPQLNLQASLDTGVPVFHEPEVVEHLPKIRNRRKSALT